MADALYRRHTAQGISILFGRNISALERRSLRHVATASDGTRTEADLIVIGVGAELNDELAHDAGLVCDNGIVVDEGYRTSDDGIYAIGDVASHYNSFYEHYHRLESWENAEHQGRALAASIMGTTITPNAVPWFWTDQHGDNWQILGLPKNVDQVVQRGNPDSGKCLSFGLSRGRVVYAVLMNMARARRLVKDLIEKRALVSIDRLADDELPLEQVA